MANGTTLTSPGKCPKCGVGNLIPIADDENGTNATCFMCGWGGTFPKVLPEGAEHKARSEPPLSKTGGQRSPIVTEVQQSTDELAAQAAEQPGAVPSTGPASGGGA